MLMLDIADQIERERACDEDAIENVRLIVGRVIDDMERHVSGVEGADDSPVARWARELRRALKSDTSDGCDSQNPSCADPAEGAGVTSDTQKVTRDPADDVSMSAYDLLPEEEREAIAWVREHGGLERVKAQRRESMPRAAYERKKAGFLGHIAECETALGRRNERIAELEERVRVRERANDELNEELNAMRPRLMPEGMEWPRYESGELMQPNDKLLDNDGDWFKAVVFEFTCDWWSVRGYQTEGFGDLNDETRRKLEGMAYGTCVKRPEPKVLDADGEEIRAGEMLFHVMSGDGVTARQLMPPDKFEDTEFIRHFASEYTHRAPVLAADGKPLREGETVWHVKTGREYVVVEPSYGKTVVVRLAKYDDAEGEQHAPDQLTHERPVLDADGRPLREGETVYLQDGESFTVDFIRSDGNVAVRELSSGMYLRPERLTHERPDSWERLEEDAEKDPCGYFGFDGEEICGKCPASGKNCEQTMARDLVRRAKKLAGVSE